LCHSQRELTIVDTYAFLARPHQALTEAGDQLAVVWREIVEEAVDCFDDDAPLREAGDRTERVEPRLHLEWDANTELRIILDLLSLSSASGRTACTAATDAIFRHK
jgi:hypothetical protein